ncbi:TonB family protein [Granulicella sp. WH15]|uniref:TonB family protein n=1 Tax=Granulicella sp. WH15 TaxID=2602070 RepID=UPI0013667FC0|nr:TonB family protein [Granulicella sp. WH15]QHN05173.1 TonB family protein [Granulicella sp. WH15]
MRSTILATLILAPALLHAQASQAAGNGSQDRANAPYALASASAPASPAADIKTGKSSIRVSTGVIQPTLIQRADISYSPRDLSLNPDDNKVVVGMLVDEQGHTKDVSIVKSVNPVIDGRVLEAVRQFRFEPARLDSQIIPVRVNLSIQLER